MKYRSGWKNVLDVSPGWLAGLPQGESNLLPVSNLTQTMVKYDMICIICVQMI